MCFYNLLYLTAAGSRLDCNCSYMDNVGINLFTLLLVIPFYIRRMEMLSYWLFHDSGFFISNSKQFYVITANISYSETTLS